MYFIRLNIYFYLYETIIRRTYFENKIKEGLASDLSDFKDSYINLSVISGWLIFLWFVF